MARGKPNVDGVHDFERDFRECESRLINDDIPHEQQIRATAFFLARSFEIPVLELMRDQGFEAFRVKVENAPFFAEPGSAETKFTEDDLRRMYAYILKVLDERKARPH